MRWMIVATALVVALGGSASAQSPKADSTSGGATVGQGIGSKASLPRGARRRTKSDTSRPAGDDAVLSARERAERMQKRQDALDGMRSICTNCESSGSPAAAGKKRRRG